MSKKEKMDAMDVIDKLETIYWSLPQELSKEDYIYILKELEKIESYIQYEYEFHPGQYKMVDDSLQKPFEF